MAVFQILFSLGFLLELINSLSSTGVTYEDYEYEQCSSCGDACTSHDTLVSGDPDEWNIVENHTCANGKPRNLGRKTSVTQCAYETANGIPVGDTECSRDSFVFVTATSKCWCFPAIEPCKDDNEKFIEVAPQFGMMFYSVPFPATGICDENLKCITNVKEIFTGTCYDNSPYLSKDPCYSIRDSTECTLNEEFRCRWYSSRKVCVSETPWLLKSMDTNSCAPFRSKKKCKKEASSVNEFCKWDKHRSVCYDKRGWCISGKNESNCKKMKAYNPNCLWESSIQVCVDETNNNLLCHGLSRKSCLKTRHCAFAGFPKASCKITGLALTTPLPTKRPTADPSFSPTKAPSADPSQSPTRSPTRTPTESPSDIPTMVPTRTPSTKPTRSPSYLPSIKPTSHPSWSPTTLPTQLPSWSPSLSPSPAPTFVPTLKPSRSPSTVPTRGPTRIPTVSPTRHPTELPTKAPSPSPTLEPTPLPTKLPTSLPTYKPTSQPSRSPSFSPSKSPSVSPTKRPTRVPTNKPSSSPSFTPTIRPTRIPSVRPTASPSVHPSPFPTGEPTFRPTRKRKFPTSAKPTRPPSPSPTIPGIYVNSDNDGKHIWLMTIDKSDNPPNPMTSQWVTNHCRKAGALGMCHRACKSSQRDFGAPKKFCSSVEVDKQNCGNNALKYFADKKCMDSFSPIYDYKAVKLFRCPIWTENPVYDAIGPFFSNGLSCGSYGEQWCYTGDVWATGKAYAICVHDPNRD